MLPQILIINYEDIASQFSITREQFEDISDRVAKDVAAAFAKRWEEQAKLDLTSTRQRYIANLKVIDSGRMSGAVVLDYTKDKLIRMIEEGASAFDIKEGFKNSLKAKKKANGGWYLTVPFAFSTQSTLGDVGFGNIIPNEVKQILSKKEVNPITGRTAGVTKKELPKDLQQIQTRPEIKDAIKSKTFAAYQHKTAINQGVFKQNDTVTGQSSYGSFRRVSDNSDANSWIHPGIGAYNLAEKALENFKSEEAQVIADSLNSALQYFGLE